MKNLRKSMIDRALDKALYIVIIIPLIDGIVFPGVRKLDSPGDTIHF